MSRNDRAFWAGLAAYIWLAIAATVLATSTPDPAKGVRAKDDWKASVHRLAHRVYATDTTNGADIILP